MTRTELIRAAGNGEHGTLGRAGWLPVFEALRDWWSRRLDLPEFAGYLAMFGDDTDPSRVLEAVHSLRASEYRPPPSAVYRRAAEHEAAAAPQPVRRRDQPSPLMRDDVLVHVARAHERGARECTRTTPCPRSALIGWLLSHQQVLYCRTCAGLESGQLYGAIRAGLMDD